MNRKLLLRHYHLACPQGFRSSMPESRRLDAFDAFEMRCWRRLLRIPWMARRSNQSILKEISPKYSLEELMMKLKLQYFVHMMRRVNTLEMTRMLEKIEGKKRREWQRMR